MWVAWWGEDELMATKDQQGKAGSCWLGSIELVCRAAEQEPAVRSRLALMSLVCGYCDFHSTVGVPACNGLLCPLYWLQASVEEGVAVKDMTEQRFLESLARREVLRRTAEAAQVAQMVS